MTAGGGASDVDPAGRTAESDLVAIDVERERWYEFIGLVRVLRPQECMEPGYYRDPAWSIRDLMGHIGTWLAEAQVQLEQINADTYEGHAVDIDALNERFLEAVRDHTWETVSDLAQAGRTRMIQEWTGLKAPQSGSDVVAPQIRRRPLRRAPGPAARLGRRARRAPLIRGGVIDQHHETIAGRSASPAAHCVGWSACIRRSAARSKVQSSGCSSRSRGLAR